MRNERGSLPSLLCLLVVAIIMGLGAFGMDIGHVAAVKHQLQNACDNAAFAGAMDLSTDPDRCESNARAVAQENMADNVAVADGSSAPMNVDVVVNRGSATNFGTVQVTATLRIRHLFAPIFGGFASDITASATASGAGKLTTMFGGSDGTGTFPMAVGMAALEGADVGEAITLYLNSQTYKNAAFTSLTEKDANANWLKNAIAQLLGLPAKQEVTIPTVEVGDDIYLNNGIVGQKMLADDPYFTKILEQEVLFLPVMDGDPAYNQTTKVIGFIGVKFTSISRQSNNGMVETMVATIVHPLTDGMSLASMPTTGNATWDAALNGFAPGVVKLIR